MKMETQAAATIVAFRCDTELRAKLEQLTAVEGLSNSAFAPRAT